MNLGNGTFELPKNAIATKLRIGTAAGKIRVVLDSPKTVAPAFTQTVSERSLRLSFGDSVEKVAKPMPPETLPVPTGVPASPRPTATAVIVPTAHPAPTATAPRPTATAVIAPTATSIPVVEPTIISTVIAPSPTTPASVSARPEIPVTTYTYDDTKENVASDADNFALKLEKIEFVNQDTNSQAAEILLSGKTSYDLTKRDDRSYVLTIPGVKTLLPQLALPYFAPQSATGFTVISARITGQGLEVLVGVTPGVKIVSFPKNTAIVLRTAAG